MVTLFCPRGCCPLFALSFGDLTKLGSPSNACHSCCLILVPSISLSQPLMHAVRKFQHENTLLSTHVCAGVFDHQPWHQFFNAKGCMYGGKLRLVCFCHSLCVFLWVINYSPFGYTCRCVCMCACTCACVYGLCRCTWLIEWISEDWL
jgi:hypothetical protein